MVYVGLPSREERKSLLDSKLERTLKRRRQSQQQEGRNGMGGKEEEITDIDTNTIASITNGYTGADITNLCRIASINAVREWLGGGGSGKAGVRVEERHFREAVSKLRPSCDPSLEHSLRSWNARG